MSGEFGVRIEELTRMSKGWRLESEHVRGTSWSAFGDATGSGSDVLSAVKAIESPAVAAMASIAQRFSDLAGMIDTFATNVVAQDDKTAAAITALKPR